MNETLTRTVVANDATDTVTRTGRDLSLVEGLCGDWEICAPKDEADVRERIAWDCAVSLLPG